MIALRDYQQDAIDALYAYWLDGKGEAPLCVAPTGSGKSVIIAGFMERAVREYPGTRILVATHVKELVAQNFAALLRIWPGAPAGIYSAGLNRRQSRAQLLFAGVQSIARKAREIGHVDVMAVDEAHLVPRSADTLYGKLISGLREINPRMKLMGFTATPYRLDSGRLHGGDGALFDGVAYDIPIGMLVQRGYLAPLVSKRPGVNFDVRGLHKRGGEFIDAEMLERFGDDETTHAAVDEIIALGQDRRAWIAFCINVDHAFRVREAMRARGISCEAVTGDTPHVERDRILRAYKAGDIRCLTSVGVLTTGFDAPATDLLAFLRPTASTGLYVQMAGRAMRTAPGKTDGLVLDFAGNVERLGPIDGVDVPGEKRAAGGGDAPTKTCPECQSILWIAARECPDCGFEFPAPEPKIERTASTAPIMNLTAPEEWLPVQDVAARRWKKAGSPDSLRVDVLAGGKVVSEWVCIEHVGYAREKAVAWWASWSGGTRPPDTVDEALERADEIRRPKEISLKLDGKYHKIKAVRKWASKAGVAAE